MTRVLHSLLRKKDMIRIVSGRLTIRLKGSGDLACFPDLVLLVGELRSRCAG